MEDGLLKNIYFHILIDGTMCNPTFGAWTLLPPTVSLKSILSSFMEKNVFWYNDIVLL